jgi:AcrR family transcriptional regulator
VGLDLPQLPSPAGKERRNAVANRARILAAARRLIECEGPQAVSIERIAAEAGVGKGTVFRRFGDRAGLTVALLDDDMRAFQDAFLSGPPPLGPGAPAAQRLEAFVAALLALFDQSLEIALAVQASSPGSSGALAGALALHVQILVSRIDPELDAGAQTALLLGALSPPVISQLKVAGLDLAGQQRAARAMLRGITSPQRAA